MLKTRFHKNIIWYDFLQPTREKFLPLAKEFKINSYIIEKFLGKTNRDKALVLGDNLFLAISIPDLQKDGNYKKQEIKFILGEKYFISSSETRNEGIELFKDNFEANSNFKKGDKLRDLVVYSFLHLFEKIYENMIFELKNIEDEIEEIENEIFSGNEKGMVKKISHTNKKLIDFGKYIRRHKETWDIFLGISNDFFVRKKEDKIDANALESIMLSLQKVIAEWQHSKDILRELRDTNNSLLNSKLSETSKTFTLIAFLTLPITLFISILSIPTRQGHFLSNTEQDFYFILIISLILFIITLIISKIKKWW